MLSKIIEHNLPIVANISRHHFNKELYSGTLPRTIFNKFLHLDRAIYLPGYVDAYEQLARRFREVNLTHYASQFSYLAQVNRNYIEHLYAIYPGVVEVHLSRSSAVFFTTAPKDDSQIIFESYIGHILEKTATAPLPEAVASVSACVWLYVELGKEMDHKTCHHSHQYKDWLATYSDPNYVRTTDELLKTLNHLSLKLCDHEAQESLLSAFNTSMQFELELLWTIYPQSLVEVERHSHSPK